MARSADAADLHATAPTLLLELQTLLGALAATATTGTERGRRPFRPPGDWPQRLGELAFGVYLLADQTGVDLDRTSRRRRGTRRCRASAPRQPTQQGWPFETR